MAPVARVNVPYPFGRSREMPENATPSKGVFYAKPFNGMQVTTPAEHLIIAFYSLAIFSRPVSTDLPDSNCLLGLPDSPDSL